jgi:hypothetical protein
MKLLSGRETTRVEAERDQALDLAIVDLAEHLVAIDAGAGHVRLGDAPDLGDVGAVDRVGDIAPAGQLVALLPVLAAALAVGLAGDGAVAAPLAPDTPGGQHHVDRAEHVLHAVRMVLDPAGVHEEAGLGRAPPFRRLRISRSGIPVTSAVLAGFQEATCSATLSKPTVNCSMKGLSIHPFSIIRWSTPLNRAMSRPGLTAGTGRRCGPAA